MPPEIHVEDLAQITLDGLAVGFEVEDVRVEGACLAGAVAASGRFREAHLEDVELGEAKVRGLEALDLSALRLDAANGDWGGAQLRRVLLGDSRLTGLNLAEARLEQVSFRACKLDYANFRFCELAHVSFEECVLTGADFHGARIDATRFSDCELIEADFTAARLALVDLRGSRLAPTGSLLGLRGAVIDPLQLLELARPLAHELGITVEEG